MTKFLITSMGFNNAVRCVAGLVSATALLSFFCAIPNPDHPLNRTSEYSWGHVRRWIDPAAFKNATFNWFCASIAFMFFGFYAIFFNLEEVRSLYNIVIESWLTIPSIVGICQ
jgi:MCP family monocarboxylic acid transporter-like MFS transporter 10